MPTTAVMSGEAYTSTYLLLLLTNFGRVLPSERITYTSGHYIGNHCSYYDVKGKYSIQQYWSAGGGGGGEREIVPLEPLTYQLPTCFLHCLDRNTTEEWQPFLNEFHHSRHSADANRKRRIEELENKLQQLEQSHAEKDRIQSKRIQELENQVRHIESRADNEESDPV